MKKILVGIITLYLSGCALWMADFDNNEYGLVNKVRTIAELKQCDEYSVKALYLNALELKNYTEYIPRNQATIDLASTLYTLVHELRLKQQPISPAYCELKLNIIAKSAEEIQRVVGSKPR
jgi:hypothetical protein